MYRKARTGESLMTSQRRLGVCYYPEHWPQNMRAEDTRQMRDIGISQVRIGEFAWSRIEPEPGKFQWDWLDEAVDAIGDQGLEVMLGTPTATPPKWLIDANPDILAYDKHGRPRKFGSRRHYCFSSRKYREASARITQLIAERYGQHEAVGSWQTDNEYGCHNTVRSYSPEAERAFRIWLEDRYGTVDELNTAWGTVFWSQEYRSFDEVDLPNLTVTEANPSHVLDFYRFSSDQVVSFNRLQTDIIRKYSPGRDIVHNYMGFYFNFDHFKVAEDLDLVGWDSYPLGFLDQEKRYSDDERQAFMRQGHPDFAAFFHDLYRACGRGRWQILEQQPGPVNWAPNNPAPLPGMVRLWSHEGFAHGAETVNYFRWRQAPFAQEQMHAGLQRPDGGPAQASLEAKHVTDELAVLPSRAPAGKARVGLVFSYDAHFLFEAQPQGTGWHYPDIVMDWYGALRGLGLSVDILSPDDAHDSYDLILIPSLPILPKAFIDKMRSSSAHYVIGPRTGSKTESLTIPESSAPGALQELIPIKVLHSESFAHFHKEVAQSGGDEAYGYAWLDHIESNLAPIIRSTSGHPLMYRHDRFTYFTSLPNETLLSQTLRQTAETIDLQTVPDLPTGLRLRQHNELTYALNYSSESIDLKQFFTLQEDALLVGTTTLPPAGVAIWRQS